MEKLVELICELEISVNYIAIDKKTFKKSVNIAFKKAIKIDPYIYSFGLLYDFVSNNLSKKKKQGIIFLDDIITIPKQLHNIYPILSQNNKTMIEEAMFIKSKNSNFIQIADIFAFYIEKFFSIQKGYKSYGAEKQEHCINMYNKLVKKINPIGTEFLVKYIPFKSKNFYM